MTTQNFLWCDCQTNEVKIATHDRFDKGLSDLPIEQLPPNVNCLLMQLDDQQLLEDLKTNISATDLWFHVCPFSTTFVGTIPQPCALDNCGLTLKDASLSNGSHVAAFALNSSSTKLLKNLEVTTKKL